MPSHCFHICQYHLIWCPKFRYPVLTGPVKIRLKEVFREIAREYGFTVIDLKRFYSRAGALWSRGKFVSTVGRVSHERVREYIRNQGVCRT